MCQLFIYFFVSCVFWFASCLFTFLSAVCIRFQLFVYIFQLFTFVSCLFSGEDAVKLSPPFQPRCVQGTGTGQASLSCQPLDLWTLWQVFLPRALPWHAYGQGSSSNGVQGNQKGQRPKSYLDIHQSQKGNVRASRKVTQIKSLFLLRHHHLIVTAFKALKAARKPFTSWCASFVSTGINRFSSFAMYSHCLKITQNISILLHFISKKRQLK